MAKQVDNPRGISQQFSSLPHTHTVRPVKEYVLAESELDQIGMANTLASGFFSAASGSFLFALGLYTNAQMGGALSEKGTVLLQFGGAIGLLLAILFTLAGIWAWLKKRSIISDIKHQAIAIDQAADPRLQTSQVMPSAPDKEGSQT